MYGATPAQGFCRGRARIQKENVWKRYTGRPLRKDLVKAAQGFSPTVLCMPHSGTTIYHATIRKAQGAQLPRARKDFAWVRKASKFKNVLFKNNKQARLWAQGRARACARMMRIVQTKTLYHTSASQLQSQQPSPKAFFAICWGYYSEVWGMFSDMLGSFVRTGQFEEVVLGYMGGLLEGFCLYFGSNMTYGKAPS